MTGTSCAIPAFAASGNSSPTSHDFHMRLVDARRCRFDRGQKRIPCLPLESQTSSASKEECQGPVSEMSFICNECPAAAHRRDRRGGVACRSTWQEDTDPARYARSIG